MIFNMSTGGASTADKVKYNNTDSGLQSTDVQGAIDEVNSSLVTLAKCYVFGSTQNVPITIYFDYSPALIISDRGAIIVFGSTRINTCIYNQGTEYVKITNVTSNSITLNCTSGGGVSYMVYTIGKAWQ